MFDTAIRTRVLTEKDVMDEDYGGFVEATPDGRSDPQRVLAGRKQQRPLHTPIDSNRK